MRIALMSSNFSKCYKIKNLTDEEATLLEPASCAIHGMDKLKMPFGAKVLLIGAGPTGLILAQLIKVSPRVRKRINETHADPQMGGAGHITVAAPKGIKMDIARKVEAADAYIDLDRANADEQWAQIKKDNPCKLDLWCMSTSQTNP